MYKTVQTVYSTLIFIKKNFFLNTSGRAGLMWDLSALTRDGTQVPCIGNAKSQPLGHQGSPLLCF